MTDFTALLAADNGQNATQLCCVDLAGFETWQQGLAPREQAAVAAAQFEGKEGQTVVLPGHDAGSWRAAVGVKQAESFGVWDLASAATALPAGRYRLADGLAPGAAVHGWLLAQHRFDRYRSRTQPALQRTLLLPDASRIADALADADAEALVRDLVDTPAADLGPAELAAVVNDLASAHRAQVRIISGDALLEQNLPMIHAVGRAAIPSRAPRLIDLSWGDPTHPKLTLVGKGVCFDSGGLDIKPSSGMALMKKDMGGAAHALALAIRIMRASLPVRLRLLIPAVENVISGDAMRPGDILPSRKGLFVEIGNTDAEGRLVLGDALTLACEEEPALLIDFATLTGAARVALGPELPALFCNDDALADALAKAATATADPLWRLPLWAPYDDMLKSGVADLSNSGDSPFAGAITAGLFLQRFITPATPWAHLDLYAWQAAPRPGRPKGGAAMTLRSVFQAIRDRFS